MKIQILGYSGSGKSTLAVKLSQFYHIPYLHLDNVKFYGDWKTRTLEEQNKIVSDFIHLNTDWVIDGNYSKLAPERFSQTDISILLLYNRFFCYRMCKRRYQKYKGKSRGSFPCPEKFDFEFKKWILYTGRKRKTRQKLYNNLNLTSGEKLIFKNRKQLNTWLKSIGVTVD